MRIFGLAMVLVTVACTSNPTPSAEKEIGDGDIPPDEMEKIDEPKPEPAPAPAPKPPVAAKDADCVPPDPNDMSSGPGPSIAKWKDLDIDVLANALPSEVRDMKGGEVGKMQRGDAGHGAPNVWMRYTGGKGESHVATIVDTQHQCHCREGMGKRMSEASRRGVKSDPVELEGNPGMANTAKSGAGDIFVWVADRCAVTISSGTIEEATIISGKIDWKVLAEECAKRDPN